MRSTRSMPAVRACAVLALFAATISLAGCASGATKTPSSDLSQTELHPVGDAGQWFDDGYAAGISGTYATTHPVCGITEGTIIEMQTGPGPASRVVARTMTTGDLVWEVDDARCSHDSIVDETVLVTRSPLSDPNCQLLDAETGAPKIDLGLENERSTPEIITKVDTLLILSTDSTLTGLRDGAREWTTALPSGAAVTALDDGYLGVLDGLGDQLQIVDGRTGDTVLARSVDRGDWITWASDGYIEKINESDPEYAYFDLNGTKVDRTVGSSQYRFVPAPLNGVTFPLADHIAAGRVVGVSAEGIPSLYQDDQQRDLTRDGGIVDLPDSIISLRALSADGSLMLFTTDAVPALVIDGSGDEVFSWPVPSDELRVESGYIVTTSGPTTQVLLHAGESRVA